MATAAAPWRMTESWSASVRPILSPMWPMSTPPTGRATKAAPKTASVASSEPPPPPPSQPAPLPPSSPVPPEGKKLSPISTAKAP